MKINFQKLLGESYKEENAFSAILQGIIEYAFEDFVEEEIIPTESDMGIAIEREMHNFYIDLEMWKAEEIIRDYPFGIAEALECLRLRLIATCCGVNSIDLDEMVYAIIDYHIPRYDDLVDECKRVMGKED